MGDDELFEKFKKKFGHYPSNDGSALKSCNAMILMNHLENLQRIADGRIDGWMDYIDPTLTYRENKTLLQEKVGRYDERSVFKTDRRNAERNREAEINAITEKKRKEIDDSGIQNNGDQVGVEDDAMEWTADDLNQTAKSNNSEETATEVVSTSQESDYVGSAPKGNYGHATFSAPRPLIALIDRIKDERDLDSRRAAIEDMIASEEMVHYFQDDDGNYWPEWIAAIEASKHLNQDTSK